MDVVGCELGSSVVGGSVGGLKNVAAPDASLGNMDTTNSKSSAVVVVVLVSPDAIFGNMMDGDRRVVGPAIFLFGLFTSFCFCWNSKWPSFGLERICVL